MMLGRVLGGAGHLGGRKKISIFSPIKKRVRVYLRGKVDCILL